MNLLGIDMGTTGFKLALFTTDGDILDSVYREYDQNESQPGWAELDATAIWADVKAAITAVCARNSLANIQALSVSSMGEAVVPVSADRRILGPSISNFDYRGEEFLNELSLKLTPEYLYAINGNTLGNHYTLTKLKWIQSHQPGLYDQTYKFLHWSGLLAFMLGAEPAVDFSLANRTLLFDINRCLWSDELLSAAGLDRSKLPDPVPSAMQIGHVSDHIAAEVGLPKKLPIISGAHDQNANAVGCGVLNPGSAVYSMGTFQCITPVFSTQPTTDLMIERGLNTEHHAIPDRFVSFIYNQGGSIVKWYRDTFARSEKHQAGTSGAAIYPTLFAEISNDVSRVVVLPHFSTMGPPDFVADSRGVIAGLRLDTSRGDILKGILEGVTYSLKEVVDSLASTPIHIKDYRAVGGGSQSDIWVQTCADIFGQPIIRPEITEAGALGAAIIAGVGAGIFDDFAQGVDNMVRLERTFEPDPDRHERYQARFQQYRQLWPLLSDYLRNMSP